MTFSQQAENPYQISCRVSYFHPPFPAGLQRAVHVLKEFSSGDGGLLPGGIIVGKVHAGFVGIRLPVLNVKKIPRHFRRHHRNYCAEVGSTIK